MTHAEIHPGNCGCVTQVDAELTLPDNVQLHLESTCEKVRRMGEELVSLPLLAALAPILQNPVYQAAARQRLHASCLVPAGLLKTVEVEGELALPQDAQITLRWE